MRYGAIEEWTDLKRGAVYHPTAPLLAVVASRHPHTIKLRFDLIMIASLLVVAVVVKIAFMPDTFSKYMPVYHSI